MTAKKSGRVEAWRVGDLALQDVLRVELPVPDGGRLSVRLRNITMADLDWQIKKERELRAAELVAERGEDASPTSLAFLKEYKALAEGGEAPELLYNVALVRQDYRRQMLAFIHQIDGEDLRELKIAFSENGLGDDDFAGMLMEAYSGSGVLPIAEVMARLELASNEGVLKRAVGDLSAQVSKKKRRAAVVGGMILTAAFFYAFGYLAGRGLIFTLPWKVFTG